MKNYAKKSALLIVFITCIFVCTSLLVICYPQAYYFNHNIEYKNFKVYYDKKISERMYSILDTVDNLIKKSELYDPNVTFKIFLRSDANTYNTLPFQFPDKGIGQVIPIIKNVFLYKSDCATNTTYTHLGHMRTVESALAHELTHVLVENKYLFKSKMAYFDKDSLSPYGLLWKEEGYAEYIADGPSISLDAGLKLLDNLASQEYEPHVEYFKYWLAVRYLIVKKNMTFKEILDAKLILDEVLHEAKFAEQLL